MIPNHEKIVEHSINRNPFNRLTTPEDVANVVYLLCKDEASWINGTVIIADGGESVR
jgi:enoyl-[acyl-carrier protein] reductase I